MGKPTYERETWANKTEFILSMLGYCVGLGNVWRFPYLAYDTGGGAFLVPYLIMLVFAGIPLMFMEMSFGQYCSQGMITTWNAVPCMRGIGYAILITVTISKMSSMLIMAYSYYYLFASFQRTLPWISCHNTWNTVHCSSLLRECLNQSGIIMDNGTCSQTTALSKSDLTYYGVDVTSSGIFDLSNYTDPLAKQRVRASEEYWSIQVRQESSSINELGGINWKVALCLLLSWLTVFFCLIKGIKSSGKVVYVTATFPYIILMILLILGLTLPGHAEGIKFFVYPRWEMLTNPKAWMNAAVQICFSLGVAWGGVITLSSYNKFENNMYIDSICLTLANSATSIFAGFVIFSVLGFMAHELGRDISTVVAQGYGLAFVVYPEAVALLPVSPLWSVLFFMMLIMLALDSQFVETESLITAIVDLSPQRLNGYKMHVLIAYCTFGFFLGLICTTGAGPYWANLVDQSSLGVGILAFAFLETVSIAWVYGWKRFKNDIRSMIGDKWVNHYSFWWWIAQWCFVTPLIITVVLVANFMNWTYPTYRGAYPTWAMAINWLITCVTICPVPLVIIYYFSVSSGSCMQRVRKMMSPQESWGPILQKNRTHAWQCHEMNGTKMGGILNYGIDNTFEKETTINQLSTTPF